MTANLWRRRWCDGGGGILLVFLLVTWGGGGGVSGQLYTSVEELKDGVDKTYGPDLLPLGLVHRYEVKLRRTCMVPFDVEGVDLNARTADDWGYFRTDGQSPYICANIPNTRKPYFYDSGLKEGDLNGGDALIYSAGPYGHVGDRTHNPYALFWLKEPTAGNWFKRSIFSDGVSRDLDHAEAEQWMHQKDRGFLFRIDVTGIKSGGRFLKGWYHLKITFDIDHNIQNFPKEKSDDHKPFTKDEIRGGGLRDKRIAEWKSRYVIDKLIVSARGRTMSAGRPRDINGTWVTRPPRRAWVGGIGEFVQDFPKCMNITKDAFVERQFMPCGTTAYAESKHGNNFYYSRSQGRGYAGRVDDQLEVYGGLSDPDKNGDEIHLNFRLDNSFCNRYYDLDFVATGVLRKKLKTRERIQESVRDYYFDFVAIMRSVSTRFMFVTSYKHHHPDYYENADPVPRHVEEVDCSQPLQGEWTMRTEGTPPPNLHRMSVTKGADLKLTGARPDATFFGALKFVIPVPENLVTEIDPANGNPVGNDSNTFNARRTWIYPERMSKLLPGHVTSGSFKRDWNIWRYWTDAVVPAVNFAGTDFESDMPRLYTALQHVLHEFDWETWIERRAKTGGSGNEQCFDLDLIANQDLETIVKFYNASALARGDDASWWPHPYYDLTCGGLDVIGENIDYFTHTMEIRPEPTKHFTLYFQFSANDFEAALPPITGRCVSSLWRMSGLGSKDNSPPACNEFFYESKLWTDPKNWINWDDNDPKKRIPHPKAMSDPALAKVVEAVDRQLASRQTWDKAYLSDTAKSIHKLICEKAQLLEEEYPDCLFIPAQPFTPKPHHNPPTEEELAEIEWEAQQKLEFKQWPAYKRGMLVSESPYTLYIWDTRLIHGCFMTVITLFVTPVSIFMTRYYKETFMDTRILLHRVWYFVHIASSFATQLLFLVGMWRQTSSNQLLGYNLGGNSKFHRLAGWGGVGLSIFLFSFGGLRTLHRKIRAVTMLIHWCGGIIFYIICLACMISSLGIPGSPAAYVDYTSHKASFTTVLTQEAVFAAVILWIIFDLIMHTVMTVLQCIVDRKMMLTERRFYFLSPVPVLAETFRFDTPGRFPRIYLLWLYVIVSLAATITACVFMLHYSPRGRGLGFMSCTHSSAETGHEVYTTFPEDC